MRARRARSAGGFTLVELMVVVAIVAVLATLATSSLRSTPRGIDVAQSVADLVAEASRLATARGPVSVGGPRTRITAAVVDDRLSLTLAVYVDPPVDAWQTVEAFTLPRGTRGEGHASVVGLYGSVPVEPDWSLFELRCFPSGACSAATLFFEGAAASRARVTVLPLGASTSVRPSWDRP